MAFVLLRLVDNGWMEMRRYVRVADDGREGLAYGDPVAKGPATGAAGRPGQFGSTRMIRVGSVR